MKSTTKRNLIRAGVRALTAEVVVDFGVWQASDEHARRTMKFLWLVLVVGDEAQKAL